MGGQSVHLTIRQFNRCRKARLRLSGGAGKPSDSRLKAPYAKRRFFFLKAENLRT